MPRSNAEETLQQAIVQHLILRADKRVIWYHVPNGESRSPRTAGRLKAMGVVAGVADLALVLPDGTPAFMEVKSAIGRQSPQQHKFEERCRAIGVRYTVVRSIDEALEVLGEWKVIK